MSTTPIIPACKYLEDAQQNFYIQQIYTGCLAEAAYYVESKNDALIIDPLRDVEKYLDIAQKRGKKIKYVFLTHFHADFVSGHLDLAQKTGAQIIYGPTANPNFQCYVAKDNEEFPLGSVKISVLHTPGHTQESSTFMLVDKDVPYCIFTGDTLFLGEVGRPDLAVKSGEITIEDLAGWLFDSINFKLVTLPDEVIVYPGHGAGSACGKNIQSGTSDTLGNQKKTNYALQIKDKDEFIKIVSSNLPEPPKYFFHDVTLNKSGYEVMDSLVKRNNVPLNASDFGKKVQEGCVIIDSRDKHTYLKGFISGSYSIDLKVQFAPWIGKLLNASDNFVIICEDSKEYETIVRMARIGFDNCYGYLQGGVQAWTEAGNEISRADVIEAEDFEQVFQQADRRKFTLFDIRDQNEYNSKGYIKESVKQSVWKLEEVLKANPQILDKESTIYCCCQTGRRSIPAISILAKYGFSKLVHIEGGFAEVVKTGLPIVYE